MIRKKKTLFVTAVLCAAVSFAGCGKEEEIIVEPEVVEVAPETEEPEAGPEEEEPVTAYPVIRERTEVNGEIQSYLTGEWTSTKQATRRPIAVMIPNNKPAMPQYGLSRAGIIYEAPVEGRITRLMAVVEDFDDLDRIGPVRSSRDYYVYVAMGYEAIYCNWGLAVPYVE